MKLSGLGAVLIEFEKTLAGLFEAATSKLWGWGGSQESKADFMKKAIRVETESMIKSVKSHRFCTEGGAHPAVLLCCCCSLAISSRLGDCCLCLRL